MHKTTVCVSLVAALAAGSALAAPDKLTIDVKGATTARVGYMPVRVELKAETPASVKKEPTYAATPRYATLKLGNGPKAEYVIAVDEPQGGDWRIYVDVNRNGDLSDDGAGAWSAKKDSGGRTMYGINEYTLRASYGDPARGAKRETSSADYGLAFYRFSNLDALLMYRQSARTGTVVVDGKAHKAVLIENDSDGVFSKPVATKDEAAKTRPVWLRIDMADDGKFSSGTLDIRAPFNFAGKVYEAQVAPDGSSLALNVTTKPALDLAPKAPERKPLLAAGTKAPDFTSEKWGGGSLKLSDYAGKVVILDFWATWCGPCQKSMPHLEEVFKKVAPQGVVVVALCVWDGKEAYAKWVPENQSKYTYQFAYDPAGRGAESIAGKLYNVSGIPTTYIIGADGKVAASVVGYSDGDKRVEEELKKLGLKVD